MEGLSNIEVSELSRLAPTGPDWPRLAPIGPDWPRQSGGSQRAPDPTFTRAGGQDDVSLNKLPQITIAKLLNEFWSYFLLALLHCLLNILLYCVSLNYHLEI